ncbi:MAG: TetR/AcrR family transcriptional regulator [Pseudomonadota bacterium]
MRREQTRAQLIQAARRVIGRRGIEGTPISAFTDAAGVGKGSFYNHFESREDLAAAVYTQIIAELRIEIRMLMDDVDDIAERIALALRHALIFAVQNKDIGQFIIRSQKGNGLFHRHLAPAGMREIKKGITAGRFRCDNLELLGALIEGGAESVVGGIYAGSLKAETAIPQFAEAILRLLDIDETEAREISTRPMPK